VNPLVALTTFPDEVLISINSLEVIGIIYLAIAVSKLRSEITRLQGSEEQRRQDNGK
jgi:hypothetical protein